MLEIILLMLLFGPAMSKHGRSGGRYSLRRVRTVALITLSTLANNIVIVGTVGAASDRSYRCISLKNTWVLSGGTAGEGPIIVGYAHGDYSVTEIKEAIEASGAIAPGDKVQQERANRLVRIVGAFPGLSTNEVLDHGAKVHTRLNWSIPVGKTLVAFAYNDSGGALTGGQLVALNGDFWVKDT